MFMQELRKTPGYIKWYKTLWKYHPRTYTVKSPQSCASLLSFCLNILKVFLFLFIKMNHFENNNKVKWVFQCFCLIFQSFLACTMEENINNVGFFAFTDKLGCVFLILPRQACRNDWKTFPSENYHPT